MKEMCFFLWNFSYLSTFCLSSNIWSSRYIRLWWVMTWVIRFQVLDSLARTTFNPLTFSFYTFRKHPSVIPCSDVTRNFQGISYGEQGQDVPRKFKRISKNFHMEFVRKSYNKHKKIKTHNLGHVNMVKIACSMRLCIMIP